MPSDYSPLRPYTTFQKDACPHCGKKVDAHTGIAPSDTEGHQGELAKITPSKGDITICMYCTNFILFGDDNKLEKPPVGFMEQLKKESLQTYNLVNNIRFNVLRTKLSKEDPGGFRGN